MENTMDPTALPTCVMYAAIFIPFGVIFVLRRDKEPIKSRYWALALTQMFLGQMDLVLRTIGQPIIPCWLEQVRMLSLPICWVLPYFTRSFALWYKYKLQESYANGIQLDEKHPIQTRVMLYTHSHQWLISSTTQVVALIGSFIFFATFGILTWMYDPVPGNFPCVRTSYFYGIMVEGIFVVTFMPLFLYLLYPVTDAYYIKLEIYLVELCGVPAFLMWVIAYQLSWTGIPYHNFWTSLLELTFLFGSIVFPVVMSFSFSRKIRKLRPADTESQTTTASIEDELKAVMAHQVLSLYFEKYAADSWAVENLIFYHKVEDYKLLPQEKLLDTAKAIFTTFLAVDSYYQVNIDMSVREKVFEAIESKAVGHDVFDEAEKHALGLLRYSIFPLWKGTKECQQAMKKANLESFQDLITQRRRKLMSPEELQIHEGYLD